MNLPQTLTPVNKVLSIKKYHFLYTESSNEFESPEAIIAQQNLRISQDLQTVMNLDHKHSYEPELTPHHSRPKLQNEYINYEDNEEEKSQNNSQSYSGYNCDMEQDRSDTNSLKQDDESKPIIRLIHYLDIPKVLIHEPEQSSKHFIW